MSNKSGAGYRSLEDRGWQNMKVLLDQEMPVNKKRVFWWYWAGAAAGIILLVLSFNHLFLPPPKDAALSAPLVDQKDSVNQDELNGGLLSNSESTEQGKNLIDGRENKNGEVKSGDIMKVARENETSLAKIPSKLGELNSQPMASDKVPSAGESKPHANEDLALNDLITHDLDSTHLPFQSLNESDQPADLDSKVTEQNPGRGTQLAIIEQLFFHPVLDQIPELRLVHIAEDSLKSGQEYIEIDRKKLDLAIVAGGLSEPQFARWSADMGAQVRYQPFAKVAFGSGLYYWGINARQKFTSVQPDRGFVANSAGLDTRIPEAMDTLGVAYNRVSVAMVDKLRYLRIPLFIQFFPSSTWQPRIGLNQLFLISESSMTSSEQNSLDFFNSGNNSVTMIDNFVRKSNLSYTIGLTYQPQNHLYLDLTYNHGRRSYLNYSVTQGTLYRIHQQVRLALGYRF